MANKLSYAKLRYRAQRKGARVRGIPFLITFEEWYNWWLSNGVDRDIPRVNNKDILCMCRLGDTGPYELGNIYCATKLQNTIDGHINNPNTSGRHRKAIMTPFGSFQSKIDAARALKVNTTTISDRLKKYPEQYYYL